MPLGLKPACYKCESTNSEIWHKTKEGNTVCNTCFGIIKPVAVPKPEPVVKPPEKVVQTDTNTAEEINIETMDVEENLAEEAVEDIKPRNEGGLGTRSGNSASGRGGKTGTRKSRGRSKKLGTVSKTTVAKGRGRRAVFKKQVCSF